MPADRRRLRAASRRPAGLPSGAVAAARRRRWLRARLAPPLARPFPSPSAGLPRPRGTAGPVTRVLLPLPLLRPPRSILLSRRHPRPLPPAAPASASQTRAHGVSPRPKRAAGARRRRSGSRRRGSCERPPPGGRRAVPRVSCHRGRGAAGPGIVSLAPSAGCQGRRTGAPPGRDVGEPGRPPRVGCSPRFLRRPGCHPDARLRARCRLGRKGGGGGAVPRPGGRPAGRLAAGSLVAGIGALRRGLAGRAGSRSGSEFTAETTFCRSLGGSHRLAVFITVNVFSSSQLKLRVLRWGGVGLAMVDFRGHLGARVCEHRSFLEPPHLVWSLISKTFLSIRAETHRNHFLFMYVDFLFSLLVFRDKYWCRSDPPTGL